MPKTLNFANKKNQIAIRFYVLKMQNFLHKSSIRVTGSFSSEKKMSCWWLCLRFQKVDRSVDITRFSSEDYFPLKTYQNWMFFSTFRMFKDFKFKAELRHEEKYFKACYLTAPKIEQTSSAFYKKDVGIGEKRGQPWKI